MDRCLEGFPCRAGSLTQLITLQARKSLSPEPPTLSPAGDEGTSSPGGDPCLSEELAAAGRMPQPRQVELMGCQTSLPPFCISWFCSL